MPWTRDSGTALAWLRHALLVVVGLPALLAAGAAAGAGPNDLHYAITPAGRSSTPGAKPASMTASRQPSTAASLGADPSLRTVAPDGHVRELGFSLFDATKAGAATPLAHSRLVTWGYSVPNNPCW